jgi:Holliday junction resolvasome RuvABC endonuclease subunit
MKEKVIVGVDQSTTSSGVVVLSAETGKYLFGYLIKPRDKNIEVRIGIAYRTLCEIVEDLNVEIIAMESIAFAGRGRVVDLSALYGVMYYGLQDKGYNVISFPPTTVKKFATNSGRASKEEMIEALPEEIKEDFEAINASDISDLADAYHIAKLAYSKLQEQKD